MNGPPAITPEQTYALLVGIEAYPRRKGLDLVSPAADAIKIAGWLRTRGVPAANIKILLSAHAAPSLPNELAGSELITGVVNLDAVTTALETLRGRGQFLFIYWTGHGIMTAGHTRRPLLANYSDADTHNLNIDSLQEHLRSASYAYPPYQVMLFDMCATLFDERLRRESLVDHRFQSGTARLDCQQFLLYAAADRQVAENLAAERTGLYFKELLPILKQEPAWPPDMRTVIARLEQRFDELRSKSVTAQEPIYQYWRAPTGQSETKYLGAGPSARRIALRWAKIAAACLVPSLLLSEFGLGFAPPWPNRLAVALITVPIPFLVYLGVFHWASEKDRPSRQRLLRWTAITSIATLLVYLLLFVQFTHALPDHWHREIGGLTYSERVAQYRAANPGISDRELIRAMGNDVEGVFSAGSLGAMRILFLVTWLALFALVSASVSAFIVLRDRQQAPGEPGG